MRKTRGTWLVLLLLLTASFGAFAQVPVITKTFFNPQTQSSLVNAGQPTPLYFTIFNPSGSPITNVAFTDPLPPNLFVFTPNNLTGSCGAGTITATAGGTSISLSGGTIPANSSCSFSVDVFVQHQTVAQLDYTNTTSAVSASSGTGNSASATLSVTANGSSFIAKGFEPDLIFAGIGTSTLRFTITSSQTTNTAVGLAQTADIVFKDTLPAGLVVASPNGLNSGTCGMLGATITAPAGGNTIQLGTSLLNTGGNTGGVTLVQSGAVPDTCSFSVNVTAANPGTYTNTIAEAYAGSNIQASHNPPTGTATLSVHAGTPAPSIAKSYDASTVPVNGTTVLTFTLINPNPVPATGVAFTDALPAGLTVADSSGPACGGTLTTLANAITLAGGTIAAMGSCTIPVTVTGTTNGLKVNVTSVVTSTDSGSGQTASALLTVLSSPNFGKTFNPPTVGVGGTSTLTFTISNANASLDFTGVSFTDPLPSGLTIKTPSGLSGTCGGGTITADAGTTSVSLSGASIPALGFCTFSVDVVASSLGTKVNTTSTITANETPAGAAAVAQLAVAAPPTITKTFGADNIALNGVTTLTFLINNPNSDIQLSGVGFADNLPTGLVIATPNGLSGDCGGGSISALQGTTSITLTSGFINQASSCTFTVNVMGTTPGKKDNTTTPVVSTEGGQGGTAFDSLTVASPPSIAKVFGAPTIPVGGTTTLTITVTNPNVGLDLTGVQFTDPLPSGLVVATPNGLSGTCGAGATITAVSGTGAFNLSGGSIPSNSNCVLIINVQGTTAGLKPNTTGNVSAAETGAGNSASATLIVLAPPSITKAFGAPTIPLGTTTSLTLTISNPNPSTALSGVAVSDTLPAGLAVAAVPNIVGNCNGGSVQVLAGNTGVSLSGGSIPASASCVITLDVVGTAAGHQDNTTGIVGSANGGVGNTANASIEVVAPPVIAKSFSPTLVFQGEVSVLTFTITNPAANTVALTGVGFTDLLPGMNVGNNVSGSCGGGTIVAVPGAMTISLSGATIAIGGSCSFSVDVIPNAIGTLVNTTGPVGSTNGGSGNVASATLEARQRPIPTLSTWALVALAGLMLAAAGALSRRRIR